MREVNKKTTKPFVGVYFDSTKEPSTTEKANIARKYRFDKKITGFSTATLTNEMAKYIRENSTEDFYSADTIRKALIDIAGYQPLTARTIMYSNQYITEDKKMLMQDKAGIKKLIWDDIQGHTISYRNGTKTMLELGFHAIEAEAIKKKVALLRIRFYIQEGKYTKEEGLKLIQKELKLIQKVLNSLVRIISESDSERELERLSNLVVSLKSEWEK